MFFSCESLEEIPNLDFSSATRLQNTFRYCRLLKELPALNTSNVTNMSGVLSYTGVTEVPNWDFSNVTNMSESFNGSNIEVVDIELPKVENLASAFSYCSNLKRVERLYAPNCTTFISTFFYARELEYLAELDFSKATQLGSFFGNLTMDKLTDVGGFKNLKVSWNTNAGLDKCPNLTYESLMNILNGLYDFVGNGEEGGKIIKLSKQAQSKLSDDDIAVAINKGWTVNFG